MSHIATATTKLRDADALCAALRSMGYTVEHHATPQPMKVYEDEGNLPQSAEIIIRIANLTNVQRVKTPREYVHFYGDLGFQLSPDGTFRCIFDDTDQRFVANDAWMEGLNRSYASEAQIAEADRLGLVLTSREEDPATGELTLLFAVRE
jgi:hypothetical protein